MPKKPAKTVLPDPLPNGEVLEDIAKKKWVLGPSIGVGGFGEIYSAADHSEGTKKASNYQYVVKIEPHGNGPLFCEMHFFMRNAKPDMIKTWCTKNKISSLGMPRYLGSGSHEHGGKKYRFLVMDKYGKDLWHIFLENKRQFSVATVFRISLQLLDVLEYIHSNGYVHADIKGANILLGLSKSQNQIYLVDYGLASKYTQKDFKPDPKKAHNGTIEYTSRDAHDGVPTRRSDLEILAYNMIQWMGTILPWEKKLSDPVAVQNSKKKYMGNVSEFLNTCFGKKKVPGALKEFVDYVAKMNYDTDPDYQKLRNILTKGITNEGASLSGPLEFKSSSKHKSEDDNNPTPEKRLKLTPKNKESKRRGRKPTDDDEMIESEIENTPIKKTKKKTQNSENEPQGNGYTAEMIRLQKKLEERNATKKKIKKKSSSTSSGELKLIPKNKETKRRGRKPTNDDDDDEIIESDIENTPTKQGKKKIQGKEKLPKSSRRMNSNYDDDDDSDDDVIEETPPQPQRIGRRKRIVKTPILNEDSDSDVSPMNLRQRK